jgi:hypothetical protein
MNRIPQIVATWLGVAALLLVGVVAADAMVTPGHTRMTEADERAYVGGLLCHICAAEAGYVCTTCSVGNMNCVWDPSVSACQDNTTVKKGQTGGCSLASPYWSCTFSIRYRCDPRGDKNWCGVHQDPVCPAGTAANCPAASCAATPGNCDSCT